MASNYQIWDLQLYNRRTDRPYSDDTGKFTVLAAGSPTVQTAYSDDRGTSLTLPGTIAGGRIKFYLDASVTSVDISFLTADGYAQFVEDVTPSMHRIDILPEQRSQLFAFPMVFNAGGTETDTGFDIPVNMLVGECFTKVSTVDAGETVSIGLLSSESGGDADGFVALASVATAGYVDNAGVITGGTNIDFTSGVTYGVLLASFINGSDAVATGGGVIRKRHRTDGVAKSISYTPSSSDTFAGYGVLCWERLP